jgi:hypothetical protein
VLEIRGVDYPYTHDLARLFALLDGSGGAPSNRDEAVALTPWGAEFRYGDVVAGALDRERAAATAEVILAWPRDRWRSPTRRASAGRRTITVAQRPSPHR